MTSQVLLAQSSAAAPWVSALARFLVRLSVPGARSVMAPPADTSSAAQEGALVSQALMAWQQSDRKGLLRAFESALKDAQGAKSSAEATSADPRRVPSNTDAGQFQLDIESPFPGVPVAHKLLSVQPNGDVWLVRPSMTNQPPEPITWVGNVTQLIGSQEVSFKESPRISTLLAPWIQPSSAQGGAPSFQPLLSTAMAIDPKLVPGWLNQEGQGLADGWTRLGQLGAIAPGQTPTLVTGSGRAGGLDGTKAAQAAPGQAQINAAATRAQEAVLEAHRLPWKQTLEVRDGVAGALQQLIDHTGEPQLVLQKRLHAANATLTLIGASVTREAELSGARAVLQAYPQLTGLLDRDGRTRLTLKSVNDQLGTAAQDLQTQSRRFEQQLNFLSQGVQGQQRKWAARNQPLQAASAADSGLQATHSAWTVRPDDMFDRERYRTLGSNATPKQQDESANLPSSGTRFPGGGDGLQEVASLGGFADGEDRDLRSLGTAQPALFPVQGSDSRVVGRPAMGLGSVMSIQDSTAANGSKTAAGVQVIPELQPPALPKTPPNTVEAWKALPISERIDVIQRLVETPTALSDASKLSPEVVQYLKGLGISTGLTASGSQSISDIEKVLVRETGKLFKLPFFSSLEQGRISTQGYEAYAAEFYPTTQTFMRLLTSLQQKTQSMGPAFQALDAELRENIADETQGAQTHEDMRQRFFVALGLAPEQMIQLRRDPQGAAARHAQTMSEIMADPNVYRQIGVIIAMEGMDEGLTLLRRGMDHLPQFTTAPNAAQNAEYVNVHVEVDAEEHLPHLLEAIKPLLNDPIAKQQILQGVQDLFRAETQFFNSLNRSVHLTGGQQRPPGYGDPRTPQGFSPRQR